MRLPKGRALGRAAGVGTPVSAALQLAGHVARHTGHRTRWRASLLLGATNIRNAQRRANCRLQTTAAYTDYHPDGKDGSLDAEMQKATDLPFAR